MPAPAAGGRRAGRRETMFSSTGTRGVSSTAEQFDLVVLGGGPGGYAAALAAGSAGMSVALVEQARVGGTCLHRGCIPAKELLQTAEVLRTVSGAAALGVVAGAPVLDLAVSQERKQGVVDRLAGGLEKLLASRKVKVFEGRGALADGPDRIVRVDDGTELTGTHVVIATGSATRSLAGLDFDGERVLSSDHVLELTSVPPRVAVVGGGAIGCEFASLLGDFGAEVTVLEVLPQILAGADAQIAKVVARSFEKRGITVRTAATVVGLDRGTSDVALRYEGARGEGHVVVDKVVVSVGRRPRSGAAGLCEAGVDTDDRGYVVVDSRMRTSVPGVFAVGDVVATPQLAHVAFAEAIVAVGAMLGEDPSPIDYEKVPWAIYCRPEVAFCGLTEQQARARGIEVETSVHRFTGNSRALMIGETEGLVKLVAEKGGPVLGVHIAGPWATELIAEGYLAVNWEKRAADIAALVHAHPTLSELFGESAMALAGRTLHG